MQARFHFVLIALLLAGAGVAILRPASSVQAKERGFSKVAMLDDLARHIIVPAYSNFSASCVDLQKAVTTVTGSPNVTNLARAQNAWGAAMLEWRSAQVVRSGPLLDQDILSRIHFWPIRRQSVEKVLRDARPINDSYIAELGAPAVGLCALEFLLFDLKGGNDTILRAFEGPHAERRKSYAHALTADLVRQSQRIVTEWTSPNGYDKKFIAAGQESVNLVVNDLLQAVEIATEERLKYALDLHENKLLKPEFIQGAPAGISLKSIRKVLDGAHRLYSGSGGFGLVDQLRQIQSPLAGRLDEQFKTAFEKLDAIGAPLENALPTNRDAVARAYEECKKLEIMLKVELVSALGVTLTFNSTDGD